ncbi:MAG: hypothetical protein GY839_05695 [candidate division Zixibacteria bacterium]|nr:hypothetical protein [candidate division Zixibacteria bacterium]
MRILHVLLIFVLTTNLWPTDVIAQVSTTRVYCGNHPDRPRFHGNGLPFELRGLRYVLTARHVVSRDTAELTYNFCWLGKSINNIDQVTYRWGNKDLDIALLEKSDQKTYWSDVAHIRKELPPADSTLLKRLALQGTTGELHCAIEGSDLNPIPVVILSHSSEHAGEVKVRVENTDIYSLSRGMSGGLVYVQDNLFGVLTAADTTGGTAIVTRWDLARRELLEYLNGVPIQICLSEWEHKAKLNKKFKLFTGVGILAGSAVALWSHLRAENAYDKYMAAIDPSTIQSRWDDYKGRKKLRDIAGIAAGGLVALEVIWFIVSPERPTIDSDCVRMKSQTGAIDLKVTSDGIALAFTW